MAVPIRLHNVPEYLRSAQFTNHGASSHGRGTESQELLQFPKSTCVLWDGTSTGPPVFLHVAQNRKPQLAVWEKLLWLLHKQVDTDGSSSKVLVGSLSMDQDAEGVSFKIDRLDTCQTDANASLLQDDVLIPVQISTNNSQEKTGSRDDYAEAIKMLEKRCSSHETLELNNLLLVKGWCSVRCHQHAETAVAHLQFDVVTLANVFKATPVNPVPVIPSALAKNLVGPRSLSHMQGRPKMGYLSMDATRKLLLVLESDPKVASLPVVGIWVSGVSMVHHPFVWGACLRYLRNERLQDRVCTPPEGFLLMFHSSAHSCPQFYEIASTSGKSHLLYDLYTGYEVTTLSKKSSGPEPGVLDWELSPVRNGPKRELFDAALESVKSKRQEADSGAFKPSISSQEDIVPRMTPAPHQSKTMTIRPMVPELSLIWNDSNSPSSGLQPFPSAPYPPSCLNAAFTDSRSTSVPAPNPSERHSLGFVPSSSSSHSASPGMLSSGSAVKNCCNPGDNGHQESDCIPWTSVPAQYQAPQTVYDRNNSARTCAPSVSSSGFVGTANSNCLPQPVRHPFPSSSQVGSEYHGMGIPFHGSSQAGSVSHPFPSSQAGSMSHPFPSSQAGSVSHPFPSSQAGSEYSSRGVPFHGSQGHAGSAVHPGAHPHQPMHSHGGFLPQSQPRPRLMAAAGMHFCAPTQPVAGVRPAQPFPHPSSGANPSLGMQRPPHSLSIPQPAASNAQHFHGGMPLPSSHPHARSPNPAHFPSHTSCESVPQLAASHAQMNSVPSYAHSAQGVTAPQQTSLHQGTIMASQGQPWPPPGHTKGLGTFDLQQSNPSQVPPPQTQLDLQSGVSSYAQITAGKPRETHVSCHPSQAPVQTDGYVHTVPPGTHHPASSFQTGNDSQQSDSTASSAKSSDDSGLSVTPDRSNPSLRLSCSAGPQTKAEGTPHTLSLASVNWAGVPNEVVQLLVQQDAQLKMLQSQIQQLLAQQQPASAPSPGSGVSSTPTPRETCSTAVNTTLLDPESPWGAPGQGTQCVSIQTSPQKPQPSHFSPHPHRPSPSSSSHSQDDHRYRQRPPSSTAMTQRGSPAHAPSRRGVVSAREMPSDPCMGETPSDLGTEETPCELRHQGPVQLSSTEHEDASGSRGNSLHSTGSLDHPSPVRSVESHLQLSNSTPSPLSASMCIRPDESGEEHGPQEISPNCREYYDQLISNIRLFLDSHSQEADNTDTTDNVTATEEDTNPAGLNMFDSTVHGSPATPAAPSGGASSSSNTTLIPHINYLSMMLGSDTDTSLEINAMAMKYLRDEQLTQVARHHQSPHRAGSNHHLLRQALAASLDATGTSDVSRMGMSATNLSMATKKYLEKHGLLGGGQGDSLLLDSNQTIRLQTDFSLAVMSETAHSNPSMSPSPQKAVAATPQHPGAQSPVKREVLKPQFKPSPVIAEERANSYGEQDRRQLGDVGASPVLRPHHRYPRDDSPEDTPMFPERFRGPHQQALVSDCSLATEDDRILDIEKLKQLPKLL
ncbi:hypothetical protein ACOMHN_002312 [Nucella lapillus]